jgi:uncharacterized protein YkwD
VKQNIQKQNKYALMMMGLFVLVLIFISPAQASEINADNVIKYVNEAREKENLPDLKISSKLTDVAMAKVNDMVVHKYFAHTSPDGLTPWYWFEKVGYAYKYAGENLAINYTSAEEEQTAWMNSPTHRKNIMNVNYTEIGVAIAAGEVNGVLGIIAVQEFGTPAYSGVASEKKDFISNNDNTLADLIKFAPAVLSINSQKLNENPKKIEEKSITQKNNSIPLIKVEYGFWLLFMFIAILPFAITRFISFGKSFDFSKFNLLFKKKYATISKNELHENLHKLKIKNYDKYQVIKVRVSAS